MDRLHTPFKIIGMFLLMITVSFMIQLVLANGIKIAYISPNFLLIVVSSAGFLVGKKFGLITGFFLGLMMDVLSMHLLGFNALMFIIIGYSCGHIKRLLFMDKYWMSLIVIGISDVFLGFCSYIFLFLLRGRLNLFYYLRRVILSEAVYTVIIAAVLFPLVKKYMLKVDNIITDYVEAKR